MSHLDSNKFLTYGSWRKGFASCLRRYSFCYRLYDLRLTGKRVQLQNHKTHNDLSCEAYKGN
jgi:hypothetical protein